MTQRIYTLVVALEFALAISLIWSIDLGLKLLDSVDTDSQEQQQLVQIEAQKKLQPLQTRLDKVKTSLDHWARQLGRQTTTPPDLIGQLKQQLKLDPLIFDINVRGNDLPPRNFYPAKGNMPPEPCPGVVKEGHFESDLVAAPLAQSAMLKYRYNVPQTNPLRCIVLYFRAEDLITSLYGSKMSSTYFIALTKSQRIAFHPDPGFINHSVQDLLLLEPLMSIIGRHGANSRKIEKSSLTR